MSTLPTDLPLALDDACALAVEVWRLRKISEQTSSTGEGASLRHVVRRLTEVLTRIGFEALDFAGRTHDPGMAPEVVEVVEDSTLEGKPGVVEETIAPTVTWRGVVVQPGQVIVRQSPVRRGETGEERS